VIKDKVYDLTAFAAKHPGGPEFVTRNAGKDATADFADAHPEDIIRRTITGADYTLALKGMVDAATIPASAVSVPDKTHAVPTVATGKPPLATMINVMDFEAVAKKEMVAAGRKEGLDYYQSGGDDEITLRENHSVFQRVWLRPRVCVNVKEVDPSCEVLGEASSVPV
jgi:L-lactate dehydrogenase (cytochrome)